MADKKKPILKGRTPAGVFVFPYLNNPDTKYNADGEFRVKLRLEGEAAETLKGELDKAHAAAVTLIKKEAKNEAERKQIKPADKPYVEELDKETGEPTGATLFNFKQAAKIKSKKDGKVYEKKVDLFDASLKPLKPDVLVYGGTVGKIAFEAWPFYTKKVGAGITCRLNAAQIIELSTRGSRSATEYGFAEEGEGLDTTGEGSESESDGEESGGESTDF